MSVPSSDGVMVFRRAQTANSACLESKLCWAVETVNRDEQKKERWEQDARFLKSAEQGLCTAS